MHPVKVTANKSPSKSGHALLWDLWNLHENLNTVIISSGILMNLTQMHIKSLRAKKVESSQSQSRLSYEIFSYSAVDEQVVRNM